MAYCSQLLNRLVEGFFRDTYDNGIVISYYLPVTFAENWTYSRALYKENKIYTNFIEQHVHFLEEYYSFRGSNERIASTCIPDNDGWLKTRSATSCALLPLILAVTCQLEHDKFQAQKEIEYWLQVTQQLTVNWPTAVRCASSLSRISWVVSKAPFLWTKDFRLARRTA